MRRNTRREILTAAQRLFNEYGYSSVSLQDIADEVGITKGNLTYYFPKKEQLVEAIVDEYCSLKFEDDLPQSLAELDGMFQRMQDAMSSHQLLYLHHAQLGQISESILQKQNERYLEMRGKLEEAFDSFNARGTFRDELYKGEYLQMIDTIYMMTIYWSPFSELQKSAGIETIYAQQVWGTIYGMLTREGREELEALKSGDGSTGDA